MVLGLFIFCEIVVWIIVIFYVFFFLKVNENFLNVMLLIFGWGRIRVVFCVIDVVFICVRDKIRVIVLGIGLK